MLDDNDLLTIELRSKGCEDTRLLLTEICYLKYRVKAGERRIDSLEKLIDRLGHDPDAPDSCI